jgi:UDP-N-acetylmuramate--alanine ligase
MFATSQHAHFIGIGGIGMSGIAEILLSLGIKVSGSDLKRSPVTDRLAQLGATIYEGHNAANVGGATVVVTSSAVGANNSEVLEAHARKVPVIQRAEMLAELMRLKYGIAIAGMHGKTTTTSMVAAVLSAGGLDPTVVVGGRVDALGSNARLGTTQYLVAEADESDRSFLKLSPILAVVTNLDREHMDCYHDMADVERAFVDFMDRVPFYGAITACIDNPQLKGILPCVQRRIFTYGTAAEADFRMEMLAAEQGSGYSRFQVHTAAGPLGPFNLHVPGLHNVLNATAAVAIARQLDVAPDKIADGLNRFRGVDRRFQKRGEARGVTVVDDYGHHPTEIRATLGAARACTHGRIHVIFQPHRFSRTLDLFDEFSGAFNDADSVIVLPIYAASEEPIPGVTAERLAERVKKTNGEARVEFLPDFAAAVGTVAAQARDGDLILTLGAGSVSQLALQILAALAETQAPA